MRMFLPPSFRPIYTFSQRLSETDEATGEAALGLLTDFSQLFGAWRHFWHWLADCLYVEINECEIVSITTKIPRAFKVSNLKFAIGIR